MNKFWELLKKGYQSFENALFPEYSCLVCGRECADILSLVCENCKNVLVKIGGNTCKKCGMPIPDGMQICDDCRGKELHFDKAAAVYMFDSDSAKMIYGLKYADKTYVARHIAPQMIEALSSFPHIDMLLPVPLHKNRKAWRGYNQSELITNSISELTQIPVDTTSLVRKIETETQTGKSKKEREANILGAFAVTDKKQIAGKNIVVVDDVFTTGSTTNECARILKKAGAAHVFVLTFLKTVGSFSHTKPKRKKK